MAPTWLFYLLFLFGGGLFGHGTHINQVTAEWTVNTNSHYKQLGDILHSFPHVNSGGVQNDVQFTIDKGYIESIAFIVIPFIVVSVLILIAGIVVACCLCCCCANSHSRYSRTKRIFTLTLRSVLTVIILCLCAGGIWGTVDIHESVPYVIDKADNSSSLIIDRAEVVYNDTLRVQQFIPDIQELTNLMDTGRNYKSDMDRLSAPAKKAELGVFILLVVFHCVIMLVTLLSFLAGCLRYSRTLLCISFFGWLGLLIIWIISGCFLAGSVSVADLCETSNDHLVHEFVSRETLAGDVVEHYILCNGTSILQQFDAEIVQLVQYANSSLQQAERSGNATEIEYWSTIFNDSVILYNDFLILENCTDTYDNVAMSKTKVCTNFMLGAFIIMLTQFFIGLMGLLVWILGLLEWWWRLPGGNFTHHNHYHPLNNNNGADLGLGLGSTGSGGGVPGGSGSATSSSTYVLIVPTVEEEEQGVDPQVQRLFVNYRSPSNVSQLSFDEDRVPLLQMDSQPQLPYSRHPQPPYSPNPTGFV
jgi:hypothetical protein